MTELPQKEVPAPLELVKERIEEVLPPAAREEIDSDDVLVVDTRDARRYEAGHIPDAVSVPSGEAARDSHSEDYAETIADAAGSRSQRIILYCGEGTRSARTADALRNEHGFENVASIIGGANLWRELGFPFEGELTGGEEDADASTATEDGDAT